jgi:hypothetical protein
MNQDQLEATVRATLAARAETVTHAPDWQAPDDLSVRRVRARHVGWLAPLAAAAAVAAIVASVVAVEHESAGRHAQPATRPPTSTPTTGGSTTTTPPAPRMLQSFRCTLHSPQNWERAITAATVSTHGRQVTPLAVDGGGQVLADEASTQTIGYAGSTVPYSHDLVLVTASGKIRRLWTASSPASWDGRRIGAVSTDGNWVAFAVLVGAASGGQGPEQIELANTATGATRTVRSTAPGDATIVLGPLVSGGSVYWTEIRAGQGLNYGPLYAYDIATGKRTIADEEQATSGPYLADGVVAWTDNKGVVWAGRRPPVQPAGFHLAAAIAKSSPLLINGSTYAWQDLSNMLAIRASRPASGDTVTAVPRGLGGALAGLTGDYVWWNGQGGAWVINLRTGAAGQVSAVGSALPGYPVIASGHTAVLRLAGGRLAVLDTAKLPSLHC